jgi:hypothetical protein
LPTTNTALLVPPWQTIYAGKARSIADRQRGGGPRTAAVASTEPNPHAAATAGACCRATARSELQWLDGWQNARRWRPEKVVSQGS